MERGLRHERERMIADMKLPEGPEYHRVAIDEALGLAVPGAWPEDEKMLVADQPKALADVLIGSLHKHLLLANIAYLFIEDKRSNSRTTWGTAAKAPAKLKFLASVDYIVEFNWTAWMELSPEQRIALVDHELMHCAGQDEKGRWCVRDHDVEEFTSIVNRWGLWKTDVEVFARAAADQLTLFSRTPS